MYDTAIADTTAAFNAAADATAILPTFLDFYVSFTSGRRERADGES